MGTWGWSGFGGRVAWCVRPLCGCLLCGMVAVVASVTGEEQRSSNQAVSMNKNDAIRDPRPKCLDLGVGLGVDLGVGLTLA